MAVRQVTFRSWVISCCGISVHVMALILVILVPDMNKHRLFLIPRAETTKKACSSSEKALGICYVRSAAVHAQVESSSAVPGTKQAATVNVHTPRPGGRPSDTGTVNVIHSGELRSHFLEVDKEDRDCTSSKKALGDCYGGAARMSYQILVNKPGISLLTGNVYGGHVWFRIAGARMVVDMLKAMDFDVMTLGIQEFHNGPSGLVPLFRDEGLKTKIVLCNVDFSRDHVLSKLPNLPSRSTILTVDNLKVGIVGYVSDYVRVMGQPGVTIIINDPLESLRNESKRLRDEGCHIVLAIGGGDSNEDRTLADSLTDITAFVVKYQGRFAYPSTATEKHGLDFNQDLDYPINFTRSTDGKQAYIFASTNHFQLLGKFQMTVQIRDSRIISAIGTPIILDLQAPEDRKTREEMDRYTKLIQPKAREVIGTTKVYIENHKEVCQTGECNGGNLLADAAFDYFSEVAVAGAWSQINAVVVNAGSMSSSFDEKTKSGEVRLEDVFQMYPYNDQYMFVTMRGTTLQNMMEHSGRNIPPYSKFLQLSGIRVKYKAKPGVNQSVVSSLLILCTSCRTPTYERVIGIQWYTLAMSRYLANGGDGYDFTRVPRGYKVASS
ncbi:hypothetical protein MTO96_016048 [Rhipicephalus appendiculatus]